MLASILALSTAVPKHAYLQSEIAQTLISLFGLDDERAETTRRIYHNSAIQKRHSVLDDFHQNKDKRLFWGPNYPQTIPGTAARNQCYKNEAPKLAEQAARQVLEKWGGDAARITHLISVSCTGLIAPGIEFYLMEKLGLSPSVNRLGINFMGCFGAFKGLSVANAFAKENRDHRILLVCTEICTLHLQVEQDIDNILGHALFADGTGAAVIGVPEFPKEKPLWEIVKSHSMGFENSIDKMTWEVGDEGIRMRLSQTVPVVIKKGIKKFADDLLAGNTSIQDCDWAIHPGGKSILQAIEKGLQLQSCQTVASWETLKDFGNMSSATFLFVLERLCKQEKLRPWTAGLGFGPGLSAEGILLRRQ